MAFPQPTNAPVDAPIDAPADALTDAQQPPLIIIISNRGPFSFSQADSGEFTAKRGAGGLVTALEALAAQHDVLWVAAAMSKADRDWSEAQDHKPTVVQDTLLRLVSLDRKRYNQYYNIIANPLLWFIHHEMWDVPRNPSITRVTWEAWREGYVAVNAIFADVVADLVDQQPPDRQVIIMPQDYHLYLMPQFLRERLGRRVQVQPFIHIPWPGPDAWRVLPEEMRFAVLHGLLESDRIGFQTRKDAFNFVQTARFYLASEAFSRGSRDSVEYRGRMVYARAYPISIDVDKVKAMVEENQTRLLQEQISGAVGLSRQLILRTDRVEPSKNILRGLTAFRNLLLRYPEHRGRVQMMMLLVPSRMEVTEYSTYLDEIMASAGKINADYSDDLWEPVRVIVGNNYHRALAAMQLYDVLLVNPIADGMNLVAKEGVLVNRRDGVLVLSEMAGAYYELGEHALTVSPFDTYNTTEALHQALTMAPEERRSRSVALHNTVQTNDVRAWFKSQVEDALKALASQPKKADTSSTPEAATSDVSATTDGVPSASTPSESA